MNLESVLIREINNGVYQFEWVLTPTSGLSMNLLTQENNKALKQKKVFNTFEDLKEHLLHFEKAIGKQMKTEKEDQIRDYIYGYIFD